MKNYVKVFRGHNVPEGATHYIPESIYQSAGFYKWEDGQLMFKSVAYHPQWVNSVKYEIPPAAVELQEEPMPSKAEWMPEVGEECEVLDTLMVNPVYCLARVKGFYNEQVWVASEAGVELVLNIIDVRFRPLKTEEEKKWEAFHLVAVDACMAINDDDFNINEIAGVLHRAGFTAPKEG